MNQQKRILAGAAVLAAIIILVVGVEAVRRAAVPGPAAGPGGEQPAVGASTTATPVNLPPGSVPIYLDGKLVAGFSPDGAGQLQKVNFVDPVEGKSQDGWLLRDVILLYVGPERLDVETPITVSSSSREKSAQLPWSEVELEENMVMFDLSNRGTLKLVAKMGKLANRETWVQDVDKIEIGQPEMNTP